MLEISRHLSFHRGAHVCHLFDSLSDQKAIALPFLEEGLRLNEACLYVTGRQPVDDWLFELQAYGVDVKRELNREALEVVPGAEYRKPEGFSSIAKAQELLRFISSRLGAFAGVRIAGDVGWAISPALPSDQVCHWEATGNLVFEGQAVQAICQYDVTVDSPALIHSALRTHPQVIFGRRLYLNPFYEAPFILENEPRFNMSQAAPGQVQDMLMALESAPPLR